MTFFALKFKIILNWHTKNFNAATHQPFSKICIYIVGKDRPYMMVRFILWWQLKRELRLKSFPTDILGRPTIVGLPHPWTHYPRTSPLDNTGQYPHIPSNPSTRAFRENSHHHVHSFFLNGSVDEPFSGPPMTAWQDDTRDYLNTVPLIT